MRIVKKTISEKDGAGAVVLRAEDSEDLWHAYHLVSPGDRVRSIEAFKKTEFFTVGMSVEATTLAAEKMLAELKRHATLTVNPHHEYEYLIHFMPGLPKIGQRLSRPGPTQKQPLLEDGCPGQGCPKLVDTPRTLPEEGLQLILTQSGAFWQNFPRRRRACGGALGLLGLPNIGQRPMRSKTAPIW